MQDMGYATPAINAMSQYGLNNATSGFNFNKLLSGLNNTIGFGNGGLLNNSMNYLNKYSDGLGALGGIYSSYNKQHMANKMYGLQKDAYNFNKMLSQQELNRRKKADKSLQSAWANSSYNTGA